MKKVASLIVLISLVLLGYFLLNYCNKERGSDGALTLDVASLPAETNLPQIPEDVLAHIGEKSDIIIVTEPQAMAEITSPLTFTGEARGNWFFEASFPVSLVNWDGMIIAEGIATAQGEWMTIEFVPFEGTIEFENPSFEDDFSQRGILIFQKANPSGLPENDDTLEIPISFSSEM